MYTLPGEGPNAAPAVAPNLAQQLLNAHNMTDATNPAAQAYAQQMLALAQQHGYLPPKTVENFTGDPAALWRAVSAQIYGGAQAQTGMPQVTPHMSPAQGMQALNPQHGATHTQLATMNPSQLLRTIGKAKAVAQAMSHLKQLRPTGLQ
jgi:hypothetical protein